MRKLTNKEIQEFLEEDGLLDKYSVRDVRKYFCTECDPDENQIMSYTYWRNEIA